MQRHNTKRAGEKRRAAEFALPTVPEDPVGKKKKELADAR